MEPKQAHSGGSDWFASWLGQCYKVQPIEGELKFEETENERKPGKESKHASKESKKKASEDLQEPCIQAGASVAANQDSGESQKSDIATNRYLIDNSVMQSNRPGVAFRHSKEESKKVKGMRAAPWGEIVDCTDEGDGWLKVGLYYLPMVVEGKPVVTLVEDPELPDKSMDDKTANENAMLAEGEMPAAPAAQEPASGPTADVIAELEKAPAHPAEDSASSPKKGVLLAKADMPQAPADEAALSSGAGIDELKKLVTLVDDDKGDAPVKRATQPQPVWFVQPSVGTWLHVLPQVVVEQTERAVIEDSPIHADAPPGKWEHCPSVGTWAQRRPVGIAACSNFAEAKLADLLQ